MSVRLLIGIVILLAVPVVANTAPPPKPLMVEDFEGGQQNRLGGFHEKFQSGDSVAVLSRDSSVRRGTSGKSLSIQADRRATGYCGVWLQFFNFRSERRKYFDSRPYGVLSFWVRGQKGGEQFSVKLADRHWIEREDSVVVGDIGKFLSKGVTTQWQEVVVPLSSLKTLDREQLGGITFDFTKPGQHVVYIDDITFKASSAQATPQSEAAVGEPAVAASRPRAMWVWETSGILKDVDQQQQLLKVCRTVNVEQLWMQLNYRVDGEAVVVNDPDTWRTFLAEAHRAAIQVHALDGAPEHALKPNHAVPLGVVDAVIDFNRESASDQRFDGIHFDNEPYLLLGWEDRTRREQILREFLELNVECQRRVKSQSALTFGIDIPFWFQETDPRTGRPIGEVAYLGRRKPASHHCLDLFDCVGVMNYRDAANGADGMIAHGQGLVDYAEKAKAARIVMGVETFQSPPADVWFVVGLARKKFEAAVKGGGRELAALSRVDGMRIHRIDDGQNVHVGLEIPADLDSVSTTRIAGHLAALAGHFGAGSGGVNRSQVASARALAEDSVRIDPEWSGFRNRDIPSSDGVELPGFIATTTMLSKITFADNSFETLTRELDAAEEAFGKSKQFGGMAVHSFESLLPLLENRRIAVKLEE